MANRVFFACHQGGFATMGSQTFTAAHGLQSIGVTTTFNLQQVFEIGQLEIYENIEDIPQIEVTLEKVNDGYPTLWHLATRGRASNSITGCSNVQTIFGLSIFSDLQDSASGTPTAVMQCSGLYPSATNWNFPLDGNFTESLTLVGNNKTWDTVAGFAFSGAFDNTDSPLALSSGLGGVQRRQDMIFDYVGGSTALDVNGAVQTSSGTILPPDIPGISSSGTNNRDVNGNFGAHIGNISVSANLGRDQILEQGRKGPYFRYVTFPLEVSCEVTIVSILGDGVQGTEAGILGNGDNLSNRSIVINTHDGLRLDLGKKMKLLSASMTGGDTGGGNQEVTYSFQGFNTLTITHPQAPA